MLLMVRVLASPYSEVQAETEGDTVAIGAGAGVAAEEIGRAQAGAVGVWVLRIEAKAAGLGTFVEVWTITGENVRPGDAWT